MLYDIKDEQGNIVNEILSTTTTKHRQQGESRNNVKQKQKRMKNIEQDEYDHCQREKYCENEEGNLKRK